VRVGTGKKGKVFEPEHILAEYPLDGSITTRGLVFCRFIRNGELGWTMQALGWGCGGASAADEECLFVCQGKPIPEPVVEEQKPAFEITMPKEKPMPRISI